MIHPTLCPDIPDNLSSPENSFFYLSALLMLDRSSLKVWPPPSDSGHKLLICLLPFATRLHPLFFHSSRLQQHLCWNQQRILTHSKSISSPVGLQKWPIKPPPVEQVGAVKSFTVMDFADVIMFLNKIIYSAHSGQPISNYCWSRAL